ncbi:hypothetical protein BU24DRAFT_427713 [Aaosphaeria arxii CBS 175.79]|uniref:F-box domain-containing protein n=1 Tax=Aaosphaeria arxii CBS 175.79 TaxID=1450172 RepID=A0A6A5XCR8_9PLEO|nr:uncharacterized protein BU24DRAFT_427713 [Aaosphaeria arxii CBS 175.79]KAF2010597.1 hypothetical protein BU24DRAFT_427713 [Aaosphaeria arxii CBS 175.79]
MARRSRLDKSDTSAAGPAIASNDEFPPLPSQVVITKPWEDDASEPPMVEATLDGLPTELLLNIIENLPALNLKDFQLATLLSLSQTNRHFYHLVQPSLYAGYNSFFCNPYLFLRTVMSNPVAAQRVRNLNLNYGTGVHEDRKQYHPTLEDKRTLKGGFRGLGLLDWKTWATECNEDGVEQEILYAAILMHTPNVTSITVDDGKTPYQTPKWIELMGHALSGRSFEGMHKFPHLRSVSIDLGGLRLRQLSTLFRVPSLQQLKLIGLVETAKPAGEKKVLKWPIANGSSHITQLILHDCWLETGVLTLLVNSCRALEHLHYTHRDERCFYQNGRMWWDQEGGADESLHFDSVFDLRSLSDSLTRHRKSLRKLHLDSEDHMTSGRLHGLRDFPKLEDVRISISGLIDISLSALKRIATVQPDSLIENLPPSLSELVLEMNWIEKNKRLASGRAVEYLAANCLEMLPLLKRVSILCDVAPFEAAFKRVPTLFSEAGVVFRASFKDVKYQRGIVEEDSDDTSDESIELSEFESESESEGSGSE